MKFVFSFLWVFILTLFQCIQVVIYFVYKMSQNPEKVHIYGFFTIKLGLTLASITLIFSFIHSIGICRWWQFLAVFRSFFLSPLLCTFSCHSSSNILPSSLTSSCHLFLVLPLNLVFPKFIYNNDERYQLDATIMIYYNK